MDKEGWWSVTPESIAAQIAERCRSVYVAEICDIQFVFMVGLAADAPPFLTPSLESAEMPFNLLSLANEVRFFLVLRSACFLKAHS